MAMNNVYYRFVHLVHADDYKTLPAKLRMNAMAKPGVDKVDFELWSLAVSAVNGCGMCLESHEKVLREHGLSAEQVQAAVRIAATVHAVARTLAAEEALARRWPRQPRPRSSLEYGDFGGDQPPKFYGVLARSALGSYSGTGPRDGIRTGEA